ncbi:MAG: YihY/virulence factor BrkB family protein [Bacteroidota bacterium]|nr:YihY/virulence factor BrkB family protein [Bacteroidota bacterium]
MPDKTEHKTEQVEMEVTPEEFKLLPWYKRTWVLGKETYKEFSKDDTFTLGAALSYYTIFSLAPMLVVIISVAGFLFGKEAIEGGLFDQLKDLLGAEGAKQVQQMVASAYSPGRSMWAGIIAGVLLVYSSTTVFGQLQSSLNAIWEVKAKPKRGIVKYIMNRVLSFSVILGVGFLLLVSLVLNALLVFLGNWLEDKLNLASGGFVINMIEFVISFGVVTLLFAMIYKILPDAKVKWRFTWIGAGVTALLFDIGKTLIGLYLGSSDLGSTYGAAGSIILVMMWVNYSSQILFIGAEFTQVYAKLKGHEIIPAEFAVRIKPIEIEQTEYQSAKDFEKTVVKVTEKFGTEEDRSELRENRIDKENKA